MDGTCLCFLGFMGKYCDTVCESGFFGPNCKHKCLPCKRGVTCHPQTGECLCDAGYEGNDCNAKCHKGFYGPRCKQVIILKYKKLCSKILFRFVNVIMELVIM